jgi:hypothetical protein
MYEGEEVRLPLGPTPRRFLPPPPTLPPPPAPSHPCRHPPPPPPRLTAQQVNREDTPEVLGLEDESELEAVMDQTGGSSL